MWEAGSGRPPDNFKIPADTTRGIKAGLEALKYICTNGPADLNPLFSVLGTCNWHSGSKQENVYFSTEHTNPAFRAEGETLASHALASLHTEQCFWGS